MVIPTYNRPAVREAVESVLNQTYDNLELTVVDDDSETPAREYLEDIEDERLTLLRHEENRGVSAARNTAIEHSGGDYLAFLDDDDEWLERKLERQIEFLENSGEEVRGCYTGSIVRKGYEEVEVIPKDYDCLKYQILMMNARGAFGSTLVLSKDLVTDIGMFKESMERNEDWELILRALDKCDIKPIKQALIIRNADSKDIHPEKSVDIKNKFFNEVEEHLEDFNRIERRKIKAKHNLQLSWLFSWDKKKIEAAGYLINSLKLHPIPEFRASARAIYYLLLPARHHGV